MKHIDTLDHSRRVAIQRNLGAEPSHFLNMHEAVFKNRLRDAAGTFGDGIHGEKLRLHVGRKARIGQTR